MGQVDQAGPPGSRRRDHRVAVLSGAARCSSPTRRPSPKMAIATNWRAVCAAGGASAPQKADAGNQPPRTSSVGLHPFPVRRRDLPVVGVGWGGTCSSRTWARGVSDPCHSNAGPCKRSGWGMSAKDHTSPLNGSRSPRPRRSARACAGYQMGPSGLVWFRRRGPAPCRADTGVICVENDKTRPTLMGRPQARGDREGCRGRRDEAASGLGTAGGGGRKSRDGSGEGEGAGATCRAGGTSAQRRAWWDLHVVARPGGAGGRRGGQPGLDRAAPMQNAPAGGPAGAGASVGCRRGRRPGWVQPGQTLDSAPCPPRGSCR